MYSVREIFKIGIGPSSSHTLGPMLAAKDFVEKLNQSGYLNKLDSITVELFGSLSATGKGHFTDKAVLCGLMGYDADTLDTELFNNVVVSATNEKKLDVSSVGARHSQAIDFVLDKHLLYNSKFKDYHPNALSFKAVASNNVLLASDTYYSIGGGSILSEAETANTNLDGNIKVKYPFASCAELLAICASNDKQIWEVILANECSNSSHREVTDYCLKIWNAMEQCINNGINTEGILAGGLNIRRRAKNMHSQLQSKKDHLISSDMQAMEWLNLYALAVNEENASGHKIVTAPTNGAAGIVPSVLAYCVYHLKITDESSIVNFLLTATAICNLCKINASISGAEVGCQGEVGSACAMAAAGMAYILGCDNNQIENAAEIALEHNLGLTCDPIAGLVQVPCIERNALAAVKAVNASTLAFRGDGEHLVSLDKVIKTMRDTGMDMMQKYKETSTGGLAVNWTEC